eukprot:scaffold10544_cov269-Chaetoceros_neogracile.AAC.5
MNRQPGSEHQDQFLTGTSQLLDSISMERKAVCGNESEKAKKSQSFLAKMFVLNTVSEATLITERNDWKYVDLDHC